MRMRINLLANLIGQGWTTVLNLAAVPMYLHLLGVDAFGLIGLFTVVLSIVSLLDAGMATTLNRELVRFVAGERSVEATRDLMRTLEIIFGAAALAILSAAVALGPVLRDAWIGPSAVPASTVAFALTMMIVSSVLRVIEAIYRAALLGLHRPVLMNALSLASSTLRIAGVFGAFAVWGTDLRVFFGWQVAAGMLTLLMFVVATHRAIGSGERPARFDRAQLRGISRFAGGAFAITILTIALTQADKIIVPRLVSLRDVGYYSAAVVIATGINQLVMPLYQTFYPRFSFLYATEDRSAFASTYLDAARLFAVAAGCPIAVFLGFAHELLFAWTGKADVADAAAPLLRMMSPGALAFGLYYLPLAALLAAGAHKTAVRTMALALLLLIPALLAGYGLAGLLGIPAAWSIVLGLMFAGGLIGMHHRVLSWVPLRRLLAATFAPLVTAGVAVALLRSLAGPGMGGRWSLLAELALVGAAVLMVTTFAAWPARIASIVRRRSVAA